MASYCVDTWLTPQSSVSQPLLVVHCRSPPPNQPERTACAWVAPGAILAPVAAHTARVFKTSWFARAARKAHIGDAELCAAVREAMSGQVDDLGGGVFKKRLNDNMHRSLILAKSGRRWVYA